MTKTISKYRVLVEFEMLSNSSNRTIIKSVFSKFSGTKVVLPIEGKVYDITAVKPLRVIYAEEIPWIKEDFQKSKGNFKKKLATDQDPIG